MANIWLEIWLENWPDIWLELFYNGKSPKINSLNMPQNQKEISSQSSSQKLPSELDPWGLSLLPRRPWHNRRGKGINLETQKFENYRAARFLQLHPCGNNQNCHSKRVSIHPKIFGIRASILCHFLSRAIFRVHFRVLFRALFRTRIFGTWRSWDIWPFQKSFWGSFWGLFSGPF